MPVQMAESSISWLFWGLGLLFCFGLTIPAFRFLKRLGPSNKELRWWPSVLITTGIGFLLAAQWGLENHVLLACISLTWLAAALHYMVVFRQFLRQPIPWVLFPWTALGWGVANIWVYGFWGHLGGYHFTFDVTLLGICWAMGRNAYWIRKRYTGLLTNLHWFIHLAFPASLIIDACLQIQFQQGLPPDHWASVFTFVMTLCLLLSNSFLIFHLFNRQLGMKQCCETQHDVLTQTLTPAGLKHQHDQGQLEGPLGLYLIEILSPTTKPMARIHDPLLWHQVLESTSKALKPILPEHAWLSYWPPKQFVVVVPKHTPMNHELIRSQFQLLRCIDAKSQSIQLMMNHQMAAQNDNWFSQVQQLSRTLYGSNPNTLYN